MAPCRFFQVWTHGAYVGSAEQVFDRDVGIRELIGVHRDLFCHQLTTGHELLGAVDGIRGDEHSVRQIEPGELIAGWIAAQHLSTSDLFTAYGGRENRDCD